MIHVIFLVASLGSDHLQVYLQVRCPAFPAALRYIGAHCSGRRSSQKRSLGNPLANSTHIPVRCGDTRFRGQIWGDIGHFGGAS